MKSEPQTFQDFNLSPELNRAITEMGYESPTEIQLKTIPLLLSESCDFLGLASTGTGKTAAFGIPLLEKMDPKATGVQALVLCPTRELAKQVAEQINLLARYMNTKALAIYGGSGYGGQLRALKEGVSIVVGTPGRIIDHLEQKTLKLDQLKTVILDEADEMISMGFREEIEKILTFVSREKHQTWLFSATMDKNIRKIADDFLDQPKQVAINKDTAGAATSVKQVFFTVHDDQKIQLLENLIDSVPDFHGLLFCQTKIMVIELTQKLRADGYPADCLHGDMEQPARERAMKAFKSKQNTIMVCTDVAARGIDVKDLTHVINYSLPREFDNYIHRIGRTGRGGKEGVAWNLVNPGQMRLITPIEKITQVKMVRGEIPTEDTIMKMKAMRALADFNQAENAEMIKNALLSSEWKDVLENMSKEEIAARFLAKTLKVNLLPKSIYEEPRRKEGFTREDRRQGFMERNKKPGGRPFRERKFEKRDDKFGKKFDKKFDQPHGKKFEKKFDKKPKGSVGGGNKGTKTFSKKPEFVSFKNVRFGEV